MTSGAPLAYKVVGTTDDVTACDCCGRQNLKATIALQPLDVDGGEIGDVVYFGMTCGARAAGWTVKDTRAKTNAADRARAEAEAAARRAAAEEEERRYHAWLTAAYGPAVKQPADLWAIGVRPYLALVAYRRGEPAPAATDLGR